MAIATALAAVLLTRPPVAYSQDYRAALEALGKAEKARDVDAFAAAARHILKDDSARAVRDVLEAYGRLASGRPPLEGAAHFHLHSDLAKALSEVGSGPGIEEMAKMREKSPSWHVRLCCLDAASFKPQALDFRASALAALKDKVPAVMRRTLAYLKNDRKLLVVDAVIARYLEVDLPRGPKGDDWNRLRLAFRSALTSLLKVSLPAAVDYKNYVDARRSDPQALFDRPDIPPRLTKVSIFGTEVTGTNIAFVVDVSGSMLSTDPVTLTSGPSGKSETAEEIRKRHARELEERRRITRAKKELTKVVNALPEGKKFNIIAFSTEVVPWKKLLTSVTPATRKEAAEYIEAMKADGITVTDDAMETAFADLAVDTIYLITDGAPTHVGSSGDGMPTDAADIIAKIHKRVRELNYFRGVRIFTLGFPEAEEDFLKKLAADNAGEYTPIR